MKKTLLMVLVLVACLLPLQGQNDGQIIAAQYGEFRVSGLTVGAWVAWDEAVLTEPFPLTSTTALAARTARERKPELVNNFSSARHANVFEAVPLGRDPNELIQKIMSAPIMDGARVHGVVQISRKARSLSQAGADFTQKDLRTLVALSSTLDRFLKLCQVE